MGFDRTDTNLALNQQSWQIDTSHDGTSGRAVDGNADRDYGAQSCTHTPSLQNAWWAVDLASAYDVGAVRVVNRDTLKGSLLGPFSRMIRSSKIGNPRFVFG